jgi:hypothetical protein
MRYEHVLLNVKGTRAPCLVVDARTTYGRIAYIAMYMTTDVTFNGASTLDDERVKRRTKTHKRQTQLCHQN